MAFFKLKQHVCWMQLRSKTTLPDYLVSHWRISAFRLQVKGMSWIEDQVNHTQKAGESDAGKVPVRVEAQVEQVWQNMVAAFREDVEEFKRLNGDASFEQDYEFQCHISNPAAKTAAVVTADITAQTISYR